MVTAYLLVLYLSSAGDDLAGAAGNCFGYSFALLTIVGFGLAWFQTLPRRNRPDGQFCTDGGLFYLY